MTMSGTTTGVGGRCSLDRISRQEGARTPARSERLDTFSFSDRLVVGCCCYAGSSCTSSPPPKSSALVLSTILVVEACGIVGRASLSFASDVLGEGGSVVIIATRPRPLRRSPRPRRRAPSHSPSTGVFDGDLGDHMERPRQVRAWSPCLAGCGSGLCSKGGSYLLAPAVVLALQCVLRCVPKQ